METKRILQFGPFRLDAQARRLSRGSETIELTPKALDTLCYLASNAGRVLAKEELLKGIWPDRFVSEANLMQHISVLRRVLGEFETETKYIGTFQGRGYAFLAPVSSVAEPLDVANVPATQRVKRVLWATAALAVAAAAAFFAARTLSTKPPPIVHQRPLTRLPGSEYQPAISRDGAKVAFIWRKPLGEGTLVLVKGAEDDEPRQITTGPADYSSPAWSPDGRLLAYLHRDGAALQLVVRPERGGQERVVARLFPSRFGLGCHHLDWSPDGKMIAVDDKPSATDPLAIFLVDVATGRRTVATQPAKGTIGDVAPRFSPDGRRLSFVRMGTWFHQDLYTLDLRGGEVARWTSERKQISGHDWAPDGSSIHVASNRGGEFRIWKVTRAGGNAVPKWQATPVASLNTIQFSAARTGREVVFSDLAQDLNIWSLDTSSPASGAPDWRRVVASTAADFLPQLSGDGRRICFLSDRSGEQQLWVSDAAGGTAIQLTRQGLRPFTGRWSPDGRKIVFHDVATMTIYVIDSTGGVPERVGASGMGGHPVFTPDGQGFFYNHASRLLRHNLKTGSGGILVENPGSWKQSSRDGRFLYFSGSLVDSTIQRLEIATGKCDSVSGE